MTQETTPLEVNAIVGKILALVDEHVSCSREILSAALKVAATTVDETNNAQHAATFGAQVRANILRQTGKR